MTARLIAVERARKEGIRILRSLSLGIVVGFVVQSAGFAQGTLRFDFAGLPPGQVLAEQFAGSGVHFITFGNAAPAVTAQAPEFFSPGGRTVGYGMIFGIRLDQSVTSLALDIGQPPFISQPAVPNWSIRARDGTGTFVSADAGNFLAEQRNHVIVSYPANLDVRTVVIEGWVATGENFHNNIFFDDIAITLIPEPTTWFMFLLGTAGLFCSGRWGALPKTRHEVQE